MGCQSLLQGIFPTQGSNPVLLHGRQILYHLSHKGSPCFEREGVEYQLQPFSYTKDTGKEGRESLHRIIYIDRFLTAERLGSLLSVKIHSSPPIWERSGFSNVAVSVLSQRSHLGTEKWNVSLRTTVPFKAPNDHLKVELISHWLWNWRKEERLVVQSCWMANQWVLWSWLSLCGHRRWFLRAALAPSPQPPPQHRCFWSRMNGGRAFPGLLNSEHRRSSFSLSHLWVPHC